MLHRLQLLLLIAALLGCGVTQADDRRDHDRARAAVQAGQVQPLATVLERLVREHPGQVLEVELEEEHGRWTYELKLLQPGGRLARLRVDARTGDVLPRRERR